MKSPNDGHYTKQETRCFVSCCALPYRRLEYYEVPEPVYSYILQLEHEITTGSGVVKRLYPDRFTLNDTQQTDETI